MEQLNLSEEITNSLNLDLERLHSATSVEIRQMIQEHVDSCPDHIQALTGEKPPTWKDAIGRLGKLESMAEMTGTDEDRDTYFWYAEWMLMTSLYLIACKLEATGKRDKEIQNDPD